MSPARTAGPAVLIVEDDASTREAVCTALGGRGYQVTEAASGEAALDVLDKRPFAAVVTDLKMGAVGGQQVLEHALQRHPETTVIVVTGFGSVQAAMDAVRAGAWDFLTKPIDLDRLELSLGKGLGQGRLVDENRALRARLKGARHRGRLVGASPALLDLLEMVERVGASDASVLVTGESGVGKELIVEALHHHSARAERPLLRVNVPSLSGSLFESELFGHERGAFTGAHRTHRGRFEAADGGTLFLDEIGDLPLPAQSKLLRAIEYGTIERVGSNRPIQVDVRVVAATNCDLSAEVQAGRFREDLYYRLAVVQLDVPPLRQRRGDLPLLVRHFVSELARTHGRPALEIADDAMAALQAWHWPGNVRELRNCVESAVVLARGQRLTLADLPEHLHQDRGETIVLRVGTTLGAAERALVMATLRASGGNKAATARTLGIGLRTLYRRLEGWDELD